METKNSKTPKHKWEKYAGPKKPSMKRRMEGHDYSDRGIYMITMAIEGRKPLLGTLHGDPSATEGSRIDDNPRRLLLKRQHPEYFTRLGTINAAGFQMQAIGNRFLLDNPVKLQIQCSRRLTPEEIEHQKATMLYQACDQGAILVSPCISPGEQQIATAALAIDNMRQRCLQLNNIAATICSNL